MSDTLANALSDANRSSTVLQGIAHPPTVNPLAGIGTAMELVQRMQGLDQSYAKQQFGRALQQATDANGNVDYPTAIKIASQDPRTAYAMQQGLLDSASLRGSQLNNVAGAQKLFFDHMATLARDPSDANLAAAHADFIAHGGPSPEAEREYARWQAMSEPERQRAAVRLGVTQPDLLHGVAGQTGTLNTGSQTIPTYLTPGLPGYGGPTITTGGGGVGHTLTPSEASSPQTRTNPDGTTTTAPAQTFAPGWTLPPQARGGGQNPMGTGRYNPQGGAGGAPGGGTGAGGGAGAVPGAGGTATKVDPLVVGGNEADFKQYRADMTGVGQHYQNINTLNNARSALEQARTGKGVTPFQTLMSVINTIAPGWTPQGAKDQVEAYDLAKKYLSDYARTSGAATHSDAQLEAAKASNPSIDISNLAARDVVSYQTGRERQAIAQALEHGEPTGRGYQKHAADFGGKTDPRGFAWDTYTDEQKAAIQDGLKNDKAGLAKLAYSIGLAKRRNLANIAPPAAPTLTPSTPPPRPPPQVPTGY